MYVRLQIIIISLENSRGVQQNRAEMQKYFLFQSNSVIQLIHLLYIKVNKIQYQQQNGLSTKPILNLI